MDMTIIILWCIWALIATLIGRFCGQYRGRAYEGSVLGFCLGPLGWIIALLLEDHRITCPHCASPVLSPTATVCARCTRDLRPAPKPIARSTPRPPPPPKPAAITADERKALDTFQVKLSR